ncbi:MAG TPA: VOC family protein [Gaiella sp.]|jgi:catechol 2,3-dioxygenase-like lactoylglutathione lyase family enzyme
MSRVSPTRALGVLAAAAVAAAILALFASAAPPTSPGPGAHGKANGQLGLVGMDHVGITVPNIDEAVSWFEDVMGCVAPLTFGPFSGVQDLLDVDPSAVVQQITMVRCGRSANIELFHYTAPDQRTDLPKNSDWSGYHIAFYVTDIDAAVQYMVAHGAVKLAGPLPVTEGPAAGETINYFKTPFGTYIELISYPKGMAYERDPGRPLWSPKRNGTKPVVTSVPGLLGIDHVGITVPNVADAVAWFEDVLGCTSPLAFGPFAGVGDVLDVDPAAVIEHIQHVRCGDGPSVELFQYTSPDQEQEFRRNSDVGGKHLAFYVRHIDKAVARLVALGAEKLAGPLPVTEGPAAGQTINYFRTPFGTYLELISYPKGEAYAETAPIDLWDPRDNRP